MYVLNITIDVDSGGMVGGPNNVLSQAGVVTRIVQPNSLNVQTAIPPHSHILVRSHLTDCRLKRFKWNHGYLTHRQNKAIVGHLKSIHCVSVFLRGHSCVATASQAVDSQPAAHRAKSPAGPRPHWAQSDSLQWQARLQMPCKQLYRAYVRKTGWENDRKVLKNIIKYIHVSRKFQKPVKLFDTVEYYSMWVAACSVHRGQKCTHTDQVPLSVWEHNPNN